jgi:DNA modification methylase
MAVRIITADVLAGLAQLADDSVHCCVTSPPYWGLRDYGVEGQIGLEPTPDAFVAKLVEVFREVRRVLRKDGTLWMNLGDSYANDGKWGGSSGGKHVKALHGNCGIGRGKRDTGLKPKDLVGIPWMVAFALRADGWYLRQEIIWNKPNPMPESVTDRCTKAHEHVFLLAKHERYFYDAAAIREGRAGDEDANGFRGGSYVAGEPGKRQTVGNKRVKVPAGWDTQTGPHGSFHRNGRSNGVRPEKVRGLTPRHDGHINHTALDVTPRGEGRNKRSVWTIATQPFPEAHFATFPEELAETCIKAGCPAGGTVLDPFGGAGTTGLVADKLGRNAVLIELKPEYAAMAARRIRNDCPMFAQVLP